MQCPVFVQGYGMIDATGNLLYTAKVGIQSGDMAIRCVAKPQLPRSVPAPPAHTAIVMHGKSVIPSAVRGLDARDRA